MKQNSVFKISRKNFKTTQICISWTPKFYNKGLSGPMPPGYATGYN